MRILRFRNPSAPRSLRAQAHPRGIETEIVRMEDRLSHLLRKSFERPYRPGIAWAFLWLSVALGHRISPRSWWLPLAILPAAGLGTKLAKGKRDPWFVAGGGTIAFIWATVGWALIAPWTLAMSLAWLITLLGLWGAWWWHSRGRSKVSVPGLKLWQMEYWEVRRKLSLILETWPYTMAAAGVRGCRGTHIIKIPYGYRVTVELTGESHVGTLDASRDRLAVSLAAYAGLGVTVEGDRQHSHRGTVTVWMEEPNQESLPWKSPTPPVKVTDPIWLGRFADLSDCWFRLVPKAGQCHDLIVSGVKGSGKSTILQAILGHLVMCSDAVVWTWDPKRGMEFGRWELAGVRVARSFQEHVAQVKQAVAILEDRKERCAREGKRWWTPSNADPQLVLMVDEAKAIVNHKLMRDDWELLASQGRALGIVIVLATQRASIDSLVSGDFRSHFTAQIVTQVQRAEDIRVALGQGKAKEGWRPDRVPRAGSYSLMDADHLIPQRAQSAWFSNELIDELVRMPAPWRAKLDVVASTNPEVITPALSSNVEGDRLLESIKQSGGEGVRVRDLDLEKLGMSKTVIYSRLSTLVAGGHIVRDDGYRYRSTTIDLEDECY
jgi:DNA segregation ATPase FtsK/SpoIIIE, S-DNA-T family